MSSTSLTCIKPPVYTISTLEARFEKVRPMGGGGEGRVYEVKERSTGDKRALKIARNNWGITRDNIEVIRTISLILKEEISPHLTRVDELFSVECPVFARLAGNSGNNFFDVESDENEGKIFQRRAFLMEILEGDVADLCSKGLREDVQITYEIQILSVKIILDRRNVVCHDSNKSKNILYKKIGAEDVFHGKSMRNFDFWKYTFGRYELYLPRPEHLVKLTDYDPWIVPFESEMEKDTQSPEDSLINSCQHWCVTLNEVTEMFKMPKDSTARILEIFNSSN